MRLLAAAMFALFAGPAAAVPACPPGNEPFPSFYRDREPFDTAIAEARSEPVSSSRITGVIVPHHLTADHLIAKGIKAASGHTYRRVILLHPDHFRQADKPFATTTRDFQTILGSVKTDAEAAERLLASGLVEPSCLFARDHGIHALLPFVSHYLDNMPILPVAISIKSQRKDWDALAKVLLPLVDDETLILESTDFSHYLPHHQARLRDQQVLNILASGSLDELAKLVQPDHVDSLGALYVQMKLQRERFGHAPQVVANENMQEYFAGAIAETTSYLVALFGQGPLTNAPTSYFVAGDTNFGRFMKDVLLSPEKSEAISEAVLSRTGGRPLIVNLEGVILPNVPEAIDDLTLAMPEDLTLAWLKRLNVVAVSLANNHATDLGSSGYAETTRALGSAGIGWFGQGETLELPGLSITGLSDLDTNAARQVDLLTPEMIGRLAGADPTKPSVGFVHWGREYIAEPSDRERMLADQMRLAGASAIIGAHPHVASEGMAALAGGEAVQVYSLGNFLFDQQSARAGGRPSGQMVELSVFKQGTLFARLVPLPNLYELGR